LRRRIDRGGAPPQRRQARRRPRAAGAGGRRCCSGERVAISGSLSSLLDLRGVGPELARKLGSLDIRTPADLVATYPRAYKDWRVPTSIAQIVREAIAAGSSRDPEAAEYITVGTVASVRTVRARIAIVSAEVEGDGSRLTASWFGRRGLALDAGDRVFLHGRVALKRKAGRASVEMNVMNHRVLREGEAFSGEVVPVYRATREVSSRVLQSIFKRNLDALAALVPDRLPPDLLARLRYDSLPAAWRTAHAPASPEDAARARERLVFEEFFGIALAASLKRSRRSASGGAPPMPAPPGLIGRLQAALPFALTGAQRRVIEEIWRDMAQEAPMNRLLQGDVGSGKTLVAAAAVLLAAEHGLQSALMAPTEILAAQHAAKLAPLLLPFGITVEAVFGSMSAPARRGAEDRIRSGEALLAVGTHALLTESVGFARLGLAIIDEQHKFGVMQRAALRAKSRAPHTLHMTATPIPRTLAQTRYADLDLSVIDELPPNRSPIETFVLRASRKPLAYDFIRKTVAAGGQAYVVAPSIGSDDGSEGEITRAVEEFEALRTGPLADLRLALVHGRLPAREKDAVMRAFARGETDVLVATTVVEVGVDVPNANVMVILDANRYGLAQLHQLRGRVGRGAARSFCVLVEPDDRPAGERLAVLEATTDGFVIAEEDLRLRGEGEFAGTEQSGTATLLGDPVKDFALYMKAKAEADRIVSADPELARPDHAGLRSFLRDEVAERAVAVSS
jgi:ATP-dependent DNA helicase RecG